MCRQIEQERHILAYASQSAAFAGRKRHHKVMPNFGHAALVSLAAALKAGFQKEFFPQCRL